MPNSGTFVVAINAGSPVASRKNFMMQCEQTVTGFEQNTVTQEENHTLVEFRREEKGSTSFDQKYRTSIPFLPSLSKNRICEFRPDKLRYKRWRSDGLAAVSTIRHTINFSFKCPKPNASFGPCANASCSSRTTSPTPSASKSCLRPRGGSLIRTSFINVVMHRRDPKLIFMSEASRHATDTAAHASFRDAWRKPRAFSCCRNDASWPARMLFGLNRPFR